MGSIDGIKVPFLETYAYPASKAAVHHLTRDLAAKLAGKNITVNAIAPGPFESEMTEWMLDNFRKDIESKCPFDEAAAGPTWPASPFIWHRALVLI